MIHGTIDQAARYAPLHPRIAAAFRYIEAFDPATADGWYELEGDRVRARPHRYDTRPEAERRWETHRRYVDVQYIVSGRERIQYAPVAQMRGAEPYDAEKDVVNYASAGGRVSDLLLEAGEFAVFFHEDAHRPSIAVDESAPVRKIVVKIDLEG